MFTKKIVVFFKAESSCDYGKFLEKNVEYVQEKKGLEKLKSLDADLVILDCCHVAENCVDLLKRIKKARPAIPVIFITNACSEDLVMRVFKNGARDYFKKPIDGKELRKTIDTILWLCGESAERRSPLSSVNIDDVREILRLPENIPQNILRAILYVENNILQPLNLEKIAGEACMSKFHFCRIFKKYVGVSPIQYAINMRLKKSMTLLSRRDLSISAVAVQSGFSDLSEFNKQFKKFYGSSPTAFRETFKCDKPDNIF
jgi:AraC-like DNA-binding protein/CheY-like chemotaxis protein